jgi:hypothetical protein
MIVMPRPQKIVSGWIRNKNANQLFPNVIFSLVAVI